MTNALYYGDNLEVLREHLRDASVDLIYLDPPFNSNASYNVLFRAPSGGGTDASIEAFDDTSAWGPAAEDALADIRASGNHKLHTLMAAIRTALGDNALMAYLAMMAVRLIELHRVLKPTTRKTVEAMAVREIVRFRAETLSFLIAESDVTRLRRDAQMLAEAKKTAKMPALPAKAETMPSGMIYKGDPPKRAMRAASRMGNPLADEGHG